MYFGCFAGDRQANRHSKPSTWATLFSSQVTTVAGEKRKKKQTYIEADYTAQETYSQQASRICEAVRMVAGLPSRAQLIVHHLPTERAQPWMQ